MKPQLKIVLNSVRRCFYRDENPVFSFNLLNFYPHDLENCRLEVLFAGELQQEKQLPKLGTFAQDLRFEFAAGSLSSGSYPLRIRLEYQNRILAEQDYEIGIAPPRRRKGVVLWHWPATVHYNALEADWSCAIAQLDKLAEMGYQIAQFRANWALREPGLAARLIEAAMLRGIELGILIENGGGGVFKMNPDLPPEAELLAADGSRNGLADAFHPAVQTQNRLLMERLLLLFRDFPSCTTLFLNSEVEDRLKLAFNPDTKAVHEQRLGFSLENVTRMDCIFSGAVPEADYLSPGVIADSDVNYRFARYYFKEGDGFTLMNRCMSEAAHRYRPDLKLISDPMRNCSVYGRFAGIDAVSSWTYTNPDPKAMLFIETLRREAAPEKKAFLHTISLWNYAGTLVPSGKDRFARAQTLRMGPDRFSETAWLNFVRAPLAIGTYFGSPIEPTFEEGDPFIYSPETEKAIADFAARVLQPYGEFLSRTRQKPRRIAVLDSFASKVYGESPRPYNHYPNYAIYNFYILLAMAHLEADVIFEETIEQEGLDAYELLVLPACDTLPQSVYRKICTFAQNGGIILADQYLRAEIPDIIRLDFDFEHRKRVNANANTCKSDYTVKDDTNFRRQWKKTEVQGVPADIDQQIMEKYAERLRTALDGLIQRDYDCSSPRILLNTREYGSIEYLTAVNDHRTWGKRCQKWKAMLEKGLSESACFTLNKPGFEPFIFEIISQTWISVEKAGTDSYQFSFTMPSAGGAIFAIYQQKPGPLQVSGTAPGSLQIHCGISGGLQ
ncbi:MAG: hypothetical protein WCT05_14275, partial [Lentisphaeria bacterium]